MIKFLLLFILSTLTTFAATPVPQSRKGAETGVEFRLLKTIDRSLLTFESKARNELTDQDYYSLLMGSYYRFTTNFRMGIFWQGEQGLVWDTDWIKEKGQWQWREEKRWDFSSVLDATYSDKFTTNLVWEIKNRLLYYHERENLLWKIRPGLRYFILEDGKPLWLAYTQAEFYIPVNYGKSFLYEYWLYTGLLRQVSDEFSIGPVLSFRQRWFHGYDGFEDRWGRSYNKVFTSVYLGINGVYSW